MRDIQRGSNGAQTGSDGILREEGGEDAGRLENRAA